MQATRILDSGANIISIATLNPNSASEAGPTTGGFFVTRSERLPVPTRVLFTVGGTANSPVSDSFPPLRPDYTGIDAPPPSDIIYRNTGYVDIPANQTFAGVAITPIDDAFVEGTESAIFTLVPSALYELGTPSSVELYIRDNDATLTGEVAGRYAFYNQSAYDGNQPAADSGDDAAIATDKSALMPGGAGAFGNVTSYFRGLNGIMIDVRNLPLGAGPQVGDFAVKAGSIGDPANWSDAPAPSSVSVRRGAGVGGSDRVTLIWDSGAVKNGWLQVKVAPGLVTGLLNPDVFYFGNLVGESGDPASVLRVGALDLAAVKRDLNKVVGIDSTVDFNRDRRVNALDLAAAKSNLNGRLTPVNAPMAAMAAPAAPQPVTSEAARSTPVSAMLLFDDTSDFDLLGRTS